MADEKKILISVELKENTEELSRLKGELQKLNDVKKSQKTLTAEQQKEYTVLTQKIQTLNNVVKQQVNAEIAAEGSIKKLSAELAVNRARWDNMTEAQKRNNQTLLKTIQEQDRSLKSQKEATGRHQESVGNYKKVWEGVGKVFGMVGAAAGALWVGINAGKKVMETSEALADKWEETTMGLKEAWKSFLNTIATGDWGGFMDRMIAANKAGQEYAKTLDVIQKTAQSFTITEIEAMDEIADLRLKATQKEVYSKEQRLGFLKLAYFKEELLMTQRKDLAKQEYNAEVKLVTDRGQLTKKEIEDYSRNYYTLGKQADDYTQKIADIQKKFTTQGTTKEGFKYDIVDQKSIDNAISVLNATTPKVVTEFAALNTKIEKLLGEAQTKRITELYVGVVGTEQEFKDKMRRRRTMQSTLILEIQNENENIKKVQDTENNKRFEEQKKQGEKDLDLLLKISEDKVAFQKKAFEQSYANSVEYNNKQAEIESNAVDLSTDTEETKGRKKLEIQLKYLQANLALTREYLGSDGTITKEEQQQITLLEQGIAKLKKAINDLNKGEGGQGGGSAAGGAESENPLLKAIGLSDETFAKAQQVANSLIGLMQQIQQAQNQKINQQIQSEDYAYEKEKQRIEKSKMSASKKVKAQEELLRQHKEKEYQLSLKQWKTNRDWALTQAIIQTALATITQMSAGPGLGIVLGAIAAAAGIVSIAEIMSEEPPEPPGYASGGLPKGRNTLIQVNEQGQEAVMSAGAVRMFPDELNAMNIAGGGAPLFSSAITSGVQSQAAMSNSIVNAVKNMPAPVLDYSEFTDFQTKTVRSQERARF